MLTISCSNDTEESFEAQNAALKSVVKTDEMLKFEKEFREWSKSRAENSGESKLDDSKIVEQSVILLRTIGVSQNEIEGHKNVSTDKLALFALDQYSKKLSQMYNQTQN